MNEISRPRVIRRALHYAQRYIDQIILVKLGHGIASRAEELGITHDILMMRSIGIHVVLVHTNQDINTSSWHTLGQLIRNFETNQDAPVSVPLINKITQESLAGNVPIVCLKGFPISSQADALIVTLAHLLQTAKLVFMTKYTGVFDAEGTLLASIRTEDAQDLIQQNTVRGGMKDKLSASIYACQIGIKRVHIIDGAEHGALLFEIFTEDGIGSMIYTDTYHEIQTAAHTDVCSILDTILASRIHTSASYKSIEPMIKDFLVFTEDKQVIGCMQLIWHKPQKMLEVSFLASQPYNNIGALETLLGQAFVIASEKEASYLFLEEDRNHPLLKIFPWFVQTLGFAKHQLWKYHPRGSTKRMWVKKL